MIPEGIYNVTVSTSQFGEEISFNSVSEIVVGWVFDHYNIENINCYKHQYFGGHPTFELWMSRSHTQFFIRNYSGLEWNVFETYDHYLRGFRKSYYHNIN